MSTWDAAAVGMGKPGPHARRDCTFAAVMAAFQREDEAAGDGARAQLVERSDKPTIAAVAGRCVNDDQRTIASAARRLESQPSFAVVATATTRSLGGDRPTAAVAEPECLEEDNHDSCHDDDDPYGFYQRHHDEYNQPMQVQDRTDRRERTPLRQRPHSYHEQLAVYPPAVPRSYVSPLNHFDAQGRWIPPLSRRLHCGPTAELIRNVIGEDQFLALQELASANASFRMDFAPDVASMRPDGDFDHAMELARKINDRREFFYFGITGFPVRRFHEHWPRRFDRMILVAAFHDSKMSAALETRLISAWRNNSRSLCQNMAPGGECCTNVSPHYTYIVCGTRLRPP